MTDFALLFPGQGSQSVGMLQTLADRYDRVRETFEEAGEVLDTDLWKVVSEGPDEVLNRTEITQPAVLTGATAVWRIWQDLGGPVPARLAGHSLGEYSALVVAGALDFSTAVALVAERGRQMQAAVPEGVGAMAAILGLEDEVVTAICREVAEDQVVVPANHNSPGQIVIAGHAAAVERALHKCSEAGARRAVKLPVSVPSHSPLMQPAAEAMRRILADTEIGAPAIPVIHNCDVAVHGDAEGIRNALVQQLTSPVRWTESVRAIRDAGIMDLAECGPGKVLCGLGRRIERQARWVSLENPDTLEETISNYKESQ
ncbi:MULTISPECIES: ACP S-malonyltransferase [unclassified Wenzhouxiangella]|uniref:ACP S-malonyltransferase n=1 Tax=unclassified Wenzhouxiangella TaxID=2613841 RepID=UPI000E325916|nr:MULTISPECIES: ACP S-malonyltransferase [unclassified Wenzhouxiangella]RFF27950.1 [acyl-carrier-protein] S-malonyltransferase [Wenzhouxiangella sp. 15181]RFP68537.1 [acyl-carrier-protein] S-malonyltransferase [Wenzhouxiangella sp. 15190]